MSKYYRITYEDDGIYNALRNNVSMDEWKKLLASKCMTWLPRPKHYSKFNRSYFTQYGFDVFMHKTMPVILKYLNSDKIQIHTYNKIERIIYEDLYQVITE